MIQWKCVVMSSCLTRFALLTTVDTLPTMTEPKEKAWHEVNRLKVCAPCGKKLNKKDARKISLEQMKLCKSSMKTSLLKTVLSLMAFVTPVEFMLGNSSRGKQRYFLKCHIIQI